MNVFLSECEHLPKCNTKGPNITGVTVLAVQKTLHRQPFHGDIRSRLNTTSKKYICKKGN